MNDIINGLFELIGGCFLFLNVLRLSKDKTVKGISPLVVIFWTTWGFWNLYYYPSVNCWWSFAGGILVVSMNAAWLFLLFWYSKVERPND